MKYLKIVLVVFLLIVSLFGLGLFFSDKIIHKMLENGNTKFENINFVLKKGEIEFSKFYLKGKDLGKGTAKIELKRKGFLGLIPNISLSNMKLENVKEDVIFGDNLQIDGYIKGLEKQETVNIIEEREITTEGYVDKKIDDLERAKKEIDEFINKEKKSDIEKLNALKREYLGIQELKRKGAKLKEIKNLSDALIKEIVEKRKNINILSDEILEKNTLLMENLSLDLLDLENKLFLNTPENLDNYIFVDSGKKLIDFQNKSLKILDLIKNIKELHFEINDLDINNGKIVIENIMDEKNEFSINNDLKVKVVKNNEKYNMFYSFDGIEILTDYGINEIISLISYEKKGLLEDKNIKLVSEISFISNNFVRKSKTILTSDEKEKLNSKLKETEENNYTTLINNYFENLDTLKMTLEAFLSQVDRLDKLQRNIRDLRGIIEIKEDTEISEKNGEENEAR